jgi:putative peptide zinc metalloprotease protein
VSAAPLTADSHVGFHSLIVRPDDDDPDVVVVGRSEIGEFIELPAAYGDAISLLGAGLSISATEERIAAEQEVELDAAELVEALADLGFVRSVNGQPLPDPEANTARSHFSRLTELHVAWLFSRPMKLLWLLVMGAALVTLAMRPDLLPNYTDFFWGDYVGLTVLVNTVMMSISISMHELMHLTAARSLGVPGRIGFGTRLHNLVVQTDVTAVWGVPRRSRYRVYLAGMAWDLFLMASLTLLVAHVAMPQPMKAVLQALVVCVLLSIPFQLQVYMRTDLYYVLRDLLRTRNLFDDGLAYARYLLARTVAGLRRRPAPVADPTIGLTPHERRATRVYSVFLVLGATISLSFLALFGVPIAIAALVRALLAIADGLNGGPVLLALDSGLLVLIEGGIQVLFVVTFIRGHRHWFRRPSTAPATRSS